MTSYYIIMPTKDLKLLELLSTSPCVNLALFTPGGLPKPPPPSPIEFKQARSE